MDQDLRLKGFSPSTRRTYLIYARKFVAHYRRPPAEMGEREIRLYLLHLIEVEQVSYEAYRHRLAAVKFLYTVTLGRPWEVQRIPFRKRRRPLLDTWTLEQVASVLNAVGNPKHRVLLMTMYAAGLRISEACCLRVEDIDSKRMAIRVRDGKGGKGRYTLLPPRLLHILREYWKITRPRDWLFPGQAAQGHISPRSVQDVFKRALRKAGITHPHTTHTLRHSFATHLLDDGVDPLIIKSLLGHNSLKTTALYAQVTIRSIQRTVSPFEHLPLTSNATPKV
jgi:integrase/recombinase XerD